MTAGKNKVKPVGNKINRFHFQILYPTFTAFKHTLENGRKACAALRPGGVMYIGKSWTEVVEKIEADNKLAQKELAKQAAEEESA